MNKKIELASPPAHEVVWLIWERKDPSKNVKRTARTFFAARAAAAVELQTDAMSLDGKVYDDSPREKINAAKKTKTDTAPGKSASKRAKKKAKAKPKRTGRSRPSDRQ